MEGRISRGAPSRSLRAPAHRRCRRGATPSRAAVSSGLGRRRPGGLGQASPENLFQRGEYRYVSEVEVDRGDGNPFVVDGSQIGAGLGDAVLAHGTDPVIGSA